MNDITQSLKSKIRLYADDCVVYSEVRELADCWALQDDIRRISAWCDTWGMRLNTDKCNHIRFTRKRRPVLFSYDISGNSLATVPNVKYLGVYFSENLTWTKHVDYITTKATGMLNFIKGNFRFSPRNVKSTLYVTYIRPILEYASVSWDPSQAYLLNQLEKVQNRAARFIASNYNFRSSISQLKRELNLISLAHRRRSMQLKVS